MKKFNCCYILPVLFTCLLVACNKNNPENPAPENAVFTFVLPIAGCSDIIINKLFAVGEAISVGDSVQVTIDASATGIWSFRSDTINGVSFSGDDTIHNTGVQSISLSVHGTPTLPGNFKYSFQSGTSTVNFFASVLDKNIVAETVPAEIPYIKLTIDNIDYHVVYRNDDPADQVGLWAPAADSGSVGVGIGPDIYPNPPGTGSLSIQKNYLGTANPEVTDADFKTFFQPGAYRIAIKACDPLTDGLSFAWNDSDNNIWTTYYGNNQEGSYCKIVGITDGYNSKGKYFVKVKMRFRCKLYSYPLGQMKELTDGEVVAYFVRFE